MTKKKEDFFLLNIKLKKHLQMISSNVDAIKCTWCYWNWNIVQEKRSKVDGEMETMQKKKFLIMDSDVSVSVHAVFLNIEYFFCMCWR